MSNFDWSSFSTPKSVSQQYDVSYNGGLGKTTFFGGSQPSAGMGSGISDSFKNLSGALGTSGMSALNSVKGALSGLLGGGAQKIAGQLKDNLGAAEPFLSNKPTGESIIDPPAVLSYPSDLGKIFMIYEWSEYSIQDPLSSPEESKKASIALPLSTSLQESFNMNYSEKQLGAFGLLQSAGVLDAVNKAISGQMNQSNASEEGSKVGQGVSDLLKDPNAAQYAARTAVQAFLPAGAGAAFDRATGTILNPYSELQFDGVTLREHSFTYNFSPNSQKEAEALRNIIKIFRKNMHPNIDNFLYTFPNMCKIYICGAGKDFLYQIYGRCFLKSMTVNYAPSNVPAFFKGGEHPTEIQLTLNFGEKTPLSKTSL